MRQSSSLQLNISSQCCLKTKSTRVVGMGRPPSSPRVWCVQAGAVPRAGLVSGCIICPPTPGMLQHKAPNHKTLLPSSGTEFGLKCPSWGQMSFKKLPELSWELCCCPLPPLCFQLGWGGGVVCLQTDPENDVGREDKLGLGLFCF